MSTRQHWISVKEAAARAGFGSVNYFRMMYCDPENPAFLIRTRTPRLRIRIEVNAESLDAWLKSTERRPELFSTNSTR